MRLETALYTGASGIQAHGQAIAVVGNNISNANTTAYKESRVEFSELLPKSIEGGSRSSGEDTGSGVKIAEVKELFTGGVLEGTGRSLDAGIDGEGFFLVGDAASPLLTRAGNFSLNGDGNLVTADGATVLGLPSGSTALGAINLYNVNLTPTATTTGAAGGNLDASLPVTTVPANPTTFNEVAAAASYTQSFSVFDSLGATQDISVAFFKTAPGTFSAQAYIDGADVGQTAGTPVKVGAAVTLNFSETGVQTATSAIVGTPAYSNGAAAGNFTIDLSKFTQYASPSALTNYVKDGQGSGNVKSYEIRKDGGIYANLDSGSSKLIGTLQLANYPNKDALERIGSNLYKPLTEAGTATIGGPGTGPLGTIGGASLERSTVDLATQFTNVILLQRGYQANAQMMTKTSELLQQTLQLIR
jgi:flagellar hook protein FlgE